MVECVLVFGDEGFVVVVEFLHAGFGTEGDVVVLRGIFWGGAHPVVVMGQD